MTDVEGPLAVDLPTYARIIGYSECSFFGVSQAYQGFACKEIWSLQERLNIAQYLQEAQGLIESVLEYPLTPRWIVNEHKAIAHTMLCRWGSVIEGGIEASVLISAGAVVSHVTDPATIGPIATTVTDVSEVVVYHPGTTERIIPTIVSIAGGNLTLSIPRCRMVKTALADTPATGLDYTITSNFEATVDIYRVYNNPATNAVLVWPHVCATGSSCCSCAEYTKTACIYVRDPEIGHIDIREATYANGAWSSSSCCRTLTTDSFVRLNYRAGELSCPSLMKSAIVRLAHANMPTEPCGCDVTQRLWDRDRNIPQILDTARLDCPFGLSDGAWYAWRYASSVKLHRASVMARKR